MMEPTFTNTMIKIECDVHIASVNWPPRSFMLSVRARIAQGQREEPPGRVEALARRTEGSQAQPSLRLSAITDSTLQHRSQPIHAGTKSYRRQICTSQSFSAYIRY